MRNRRTQVPEVHLSVCQRLGYFSETMATQDAPWSWHLWENGVARDSGWAASRDACIRAGKAIKESLLIKRIGIDLPKSVQI